MSILIDMYILIDVKNNTTVKKIGVGSNLCLKKIYAQLHLKYRKKQ